MSARAWSQAPSPRLATLADPRREPPLSHAQAEILGLVLAGRSSAEIAAQRSRSRRTVENQLAALYRKLGVSGRLQVFARFAAPGDPPSPAEPLTDRERQAALLAAEGRSNKEIAFVLALAPSTVAGILKDAQEKLGVASRRELIDRLGARARRN